MKRKAKMKGLVRAAVSLMMAFLLLAPATTSLAASSGKTYKVVVRAGELGWFVNSADGKDYGTYMFEIPAGETLTAEMAASMLPEVAEGYYLLNDFEAEVASYIGNPVTGKIDLVAAYGAKSGSGIEYTIRYVDSTTGADVASPLTELAYEDVITRFAANVPNYRLVSEVSQTVALNRTGENVITFKYESTEEPETTTNIITEIVDGGTITEIRYVDQIVNRPAPNVNNNEQPVVNIPENQTPLGPGGNETSPETEPAATTPSVENIEDETVPLVGPEETEEASKPANETIEDETVPEAAPAGGIAGPAVAVGVCVLAAAVVLICVLLKRKKNQTGE
jgi:hypothetical protein